MKRSLICGGALLFAGLMVACGGGSAVPTAPASSESFLAGTWQGSVTTQVAANADGSQPPATVGATTWTFEVVPQTNLQTFKATVHSDNSWLPFTSVGTTAIVPGNTPPAQISTQGDYDSPRGCRGTFGSFGTADSTHIDADFTGVDCNHVTFTGHVSLTKQ